MISVIIWERRRYMWEDICIYDIQKYLFMYIKCIYLFDKNIVLIVWLVNKERYVTRSIVELRKEKRKKIFIYIYIYDFL